MTVRRPFACLACAVFTGATLVAAAMPASAAPEYAGAAARHAGSQIALHEPVHGEPPPTARMAGEQVLGHDVSGWQGEVDWPSARAGGARFVYVKATEGTGYRNEHFTQQYNGSYDEGILRGAYHFARPDVSGGAEQAEYFLAGGGGWSPDGRTLPGALDMEYNPYGNACYGRSPAQLVAWVRDFSDTYLRSTGTAPVIYTSTSWWQRCTGGSPAFGDTNPLWLARYAPEIGPLPPGWRTHTIWQFSDSGRLPGDQNYFNGRAEQLAMLATG